MIITSKDFQEFLVRLILPALSVISYIVISKSSGVEPQLEIILLSAIFGFVITIWFSQKTVLQLKKSIDANSEAHIEILPSDPERLSQVSRLYDTPGATIISTNLYSNYTPEFGDKDVAFKLYGKKDSRSKFIRIVSANTPEHKNWVKDMHASSKNPNYEIRVIENIPCQLSYPNFVLVKKGDTVKLFISFRSDGADGNFAFTTVSKQFTEGMLEYANYIRSAAIPVNDELLANW